MEKRFNAQVINDEILEKLNLANKYNYLNENLFPILSDDQFTFLIEVHIYKIPLKN